MSCLLLIASLLSGQAAADEAALGAEVRKLVVQLDAPQLARRDEAEKRLLELGPDVLDLLPKTTPRTAAEVAERLRRVRQRLQERLATDAAKPSLVTLEADAMPLADVLAAIEKQTGNRIIRPRAAPPAAGPAVTATLDKAPFWQTLDQLLDKAGLTVYPSDAERAIQVVPRPQQQVPRSGVADYSGPFRIEPTRVIARRDLRNPAGQALVLTVEVAWEPRLRLIGLKQRMADVEATDDAGKPLAVEDAAVETEALIRGDTMMTYFDLPLAPPSRQVREIARLKGKLRAIVPGKIATFRFADLLKAKDVEKRIAGATVVLEQVRENNNLWEVRMRVRFDEAGSALESHRPWILQNEAYLEGPQGKPIAYEAYESTRRTESEMGIAYLFNLDGPPANLTFVYKTPAAIITTEFPYELKDIKLP